MEVKPGYKQTEVGVIPEDWGVKRLGDCLASAPSYGINAAAAPSSDRLPTYIRITDISDEGRFAPSPMVSVRHLNAGRYYLSDGDLVFARTGASVGKSYRYDPNDGELVFAGFLIRVRPDATRLTPAFLAAYVTTGRYWNWVKLMSTRSGQPGINGREYASLPLPIPPLPEQRAIENVLRDVDVLIASLDRLIAKKRDIKHAAMQQLLTGQRRLPGFGGPTSGYKKAALGPVPADWEIVRLGDTGSWLSGGTPMMSNPSYWNGDVPWVSPKDMKTARLYDALDHVTRASLGNGTRLAPRHAILMVVRGMILAHSFPVARAERPVAFNQDIKALVVRTGIESDFILRWLQASESLILGVTDESTHGTRRLASEALFSQLLALPSVAEQSGIAAVLSDMDAEISVLEQQRDKTRALKLGMMQELLTGRTRLV